MYQRLDVDGCFCVWTLHAHSPQMDCTASVTPPKSLSLDCQTVFIHLWNRLFSDEELQLVCRKSTLIYIVVVCIPEEMEKDRGRSTPQFYRHPLQHLWTEPNTCDLLFTKMWSDLEKFQCVVFSSLRLQRNGKVSLGLNVHWQSHVGFTNFGNMEHSFRKSTADMLKINT